MGWVGQFGIVSITSMPSVSGVHTLLVPIMFTYYLNIIPVNQMGAVIMDLCPVLVPSPVIADRPIGPLSVGSWLMLFLTWSWPLLIASDLRCPLVFI